MQYVNYNIIYITFNCTNKKLHLIRVYTSDITRAKEDGEPFFGELQEVIDGLAHNEKVFLRGDCKSRIGYNIIPGIK